MKKRKTLDAGSGGSENGGSEKKNPGGAKKGDVRNPEGKRAGTLQRSTQLANETKITLIERFQRTLAPQMLATMLDGKLPMQFVPKYLQDRLSKGDKLTEEEDMLLVREIIKNWKWAMDWYAKIFPKTLGVFGMIQTEETMAGRVKQAAKATKSSKVIDLVRRRMEKELYEADEE